MPDARSLNLAVDRGRGDLDVAAIVVAFGLAAAAVLAVAAAAMLVVAVFATLEPPT